MLNKSDNNNNNNNINDNNNNNNSNNNNNNNNNKLSSCKINCNNKGILYNIQYLPRHGSPLIVGMLLSPSFKHKSLIIMFLCTTFSYGIILFIVNYVVN